MPGRGHAGTAPALALAQPHRTVPKSARLLARDRYSTPYPATPWATPSRPLARMPPRPSWYRHASDVAYPVVRVTGDILPESLHNTLAASRVQQFLRATALCGSTPRWRRATARAPSNSPARRTTAAPNNPASTRITRSRGRTTRRRPSGRRCRATGRCRGRRDEMARDG